MTVRVVFADDNYLVREGVAGLLTETAEIDLVESVADPDALHAAVAAHRPDAVLTDIRMPPTFTTEGIDAAKRIRAEYPQTGVVVLSQYVEEDYAFELLSDGVAGLGYLLKERVTQVDDLVRALHDVARGGSALDPKVVEGLMARKSHRDELAPARAHRPRARGAPGAGHRAQQRGDRQGAVHERAGRGEARRLGVPEARAGRRVRREPPGDGGARLPRGHAAAPPAR